MRCYSAVSLPLSFLPVCPPCRGHRCELSFINSVITADSGVSSTMQLDDLNNQQNGTYQSLPEPISSAHVIYSPPDPQLHQGPYQQPTAQASHENYTQASTPLHQGAYQQPAGQLHPGAYHQPAAQLHQGPYQSQTVSDNISYFCGNFLKSFVLFSEFFSEITFLFSFLERYLISVTTVIPLYVMTTCSSLRAQCVLGVEAPPWLRCYDVAHTLSLRQ